MGNWKGELRVMSQNLGTNYKYWPVLVGVANTAIKGSPQKNFLGIFPK